MGYELAETGLQVGTYILLGVVVLLVGAAAIILGRVIAKRNKENKLD
jgi:hypothetical protein